MYDGRLNLTQQVVEEVKKYFPRKVFGTVIPRAVRLSEAPSFGKPIQYFDKSVARRAGLSGACGRNYPYERGESIIMARKGGLGKGLDAIFAENDTEDERTAVLLKTSELEPNRDQPRRVFNEQALGELADSIAQHGVLQPLLVRPLMGGGYQIVAGERRWRAARMAGVEEVPAVVREMNDSQVMELALIENLQREDLNPLEEAQGYQSLMESYSMTQDDVAKTVGKSRPGRRECAASAEFAAGNAEAGQRRRQFPPGMRAHCSVFRMRRRCWRRQRPPRRALRCATWRKWRRKRTQSRKRKAAVTQGAVL